MDMRKRCSSVPENYFGNAVHLINIEWPKKQVLETKLADIALEVRKLVDRFLYHSLFYYMFSLTENNIFS